MRYWAGWGSGVRNNWRYYNRHRDWFGPSWWGRHRHPLAGWHYWYAFGRRPWSYWWTYPTYAACTSWFAWTAPAEVWSEPIYYDYGAEGNVVYQDDSVYLAGEMVATQEEFAQSAAVLATVDPPASEEQADDAEWLPLGTFAVSTDEADTDPTRVIQLAVNREGVVAGTVYNTATDESTTVQGQVDKETQRVAFRFGESDQVVAETGLYNLTQEEAPVLVHFGTDRVETYLFVRLEAPEEDPAP